jgi:hypothetical protein
VDLPEVTEAKRLELRPGDRLVVRLDHEPDVQEADEIAGMVRAILKTDMPVLVCGPGMDVEVIGPDPGGM